MDTITKTENHKQDIEIMRIIIQSKDANNQMEKHIFSFDISDNTEPSVINSILGSVYKKGTMYIDFLISNEMSPVGLVDIVTKFIIGYTKQSINIDVDAPIKKIDIPILATIEYNHDSNFDKHRTSLEKLRSDISNYFKMSDVILKLEHICTVSEVDKYIINDKLFCKFMATNELVIFTNDTNTYIGVIKFNISK